MFLHSRDSVNALQKPVGVLHNPVLPICCVEDGTEGRPITRNGIDVKPVARVEGLRSGHQILLESVAQVNTDLVKAALSIAEPLEVLIDVLPLCVLPSGLLFEV